MPSAQSLLARFGSAPPRGSHVPSVGRSGIPGRGEDNEGLPVKFINDCAYVIARAQSIEAIFKLPRPSPSAKTRVFRALTNGADFVANYKRQLIASCERSPVISKCGQEAVRKGDAQYVATPNRIHSLVS